MTAAMRLAQLRYDAEEPNEVPESEIEDAALDLVRDFDPNDYRGFVAAVEEACGARDLTNCPTLERVWADHQPDIEEE